MILNIILVAIIIILVITIGIIKNDNNNQNNICDNTFPYENGKITNKYALVILSSMLTLYTTILSETEKDAIKCGCIALSKLLKIEEYIEKIEDDEK